MIMNDSSACQEDWGRDTIPLEDEELSFALGHGGAQGDLHRIGVAACICDLIRNAYSHLQNKMLCHVCHVCIQCTYM